MIRPNYTWHGLQHRCHARHSHPHDESHAYRFCPRCGTRSNSASAEAERTASGSSAPRCGFVFYLDPKIAVGTIIRADGGRHRAGASRDRTRLRQVGVPGRLRRSRRAADAGGAFAKRARNAASTCGSTGWSTSTPTPAARRSSSSTPRRRSAARLQPTMSGWKRRSSHRTTIPWDDLAFRSTREALRDYLAGLLHPLSSVSRFLPKNCDLERSVAYTDLCRRVPDCVIGRAVQ